MINCKCRSIANSSLLLCVFVILHIAFEWMFFLKLLERKVFWNPFSNLLGVFDRFLGSTLRALIDCNRIWTRNVLVRKRDRSVLLRDPVFVYKQSGTQFVSTPTMGWLKSTNDHAAKSSLENVLKFPGNYYSLLLSLASFLAGRQLFYY